MVLWTTLNGKSCTKYIGNDQSLQNSALAISCVLRINPILKFLKVSMYTESLGVHHLLWGRNMRRLDHNSHMLRSHLIEKVGIILSFFNENKWNLHGHDDFHHLSKISEIAGNTFETKFGGGSIWFCEHSTYEENVS